MKKLIPILLCLIFLQPVFAISQDQTNTVNLIFGCLPRYIESAFVSSAMISSNVTMFDNKHYWRGGLQTVLNLYGLTDYFITKLPAGKQIRWLAKSFSILYTADRLCYKDPKISYSAFFWTVSYFLK